MQKKCVIFMILKKGTHMLSFPYPPIFQEKDTDYLCFTDIEGLHSKFWTIEFILEWSNFRLEEIIRPYQKSCELLPNQIQTGPFFETNANDESLVTLPSLEEIPDITFLPDKLVPTRGADGCYLYQRNPVRKNRPFLLTIGVPVSNQIKTIGRCLEHIKPLLTGLNAELLVINTGSTDGTLSVCRNYHARIIQYPWCDNMSAVRNTGIFHARGEWYLSIDDDEWFEDVNAVLDFFRLGYYKEYDTATYIQRNYNTAAGDTYSDVHTLRMAKITPGLHFEGRIHDALMVSGKGKNYALPSYVHHYGFIKDNREKARAKYIRNASLLLYDLYEYPDRLRYNYQLAKELNAAMYYKEAAAFFLRGMSIEKEEPNAYFGKNHAVYYLAALYNAEDKNFFVRATFLPKYPFTVAEKAFCHYMKAELALKFRHPPEKILEEISQYRILCKEFGEAGDDVMLLTNLGLEVCTNAIYGINMQAAAFCAFCRAGNVHGAVTELEQLPIGKLTDYQRIFCQDIILGEDEVFDVVLGRLTSFQAEFLLSELLDVLLESLREEELRERQLGRMSKVLRLLSIQGIEDYARQLSKKGTRGEEAFLSYALEMDSENQPLQLLFLASYVLKRNFLDKKMEQDRMELFLQYMMVLGRYAAQYYRPELLDEMENAAIPGEIRAAYEVSIVLTATTINKELIGHLRRALKAFPGFKKEIQCMADILGK